MMVENVFYGNCYLKSLTSGVKMIRFKKVGSMTLKIGGKNYGKHSTKEKHATSRG